MTTKINIILSTFIALTSCQSNGKEDSSSSDNFFTEQTYSNGQPKILYKDLGDTIVNGNSFSYKLKKQLDTNGNVLRIGYYINDNAIGQHKFYKNKKINFIRDYVLFTKDQVKFLKYIDTLTSPSFYSKGTYLNSALRLENGDTIFSQSSGCEIKILNSKNLNLNDSLTAQFQFFDNEIDIKAFRVCLNIEEDTSLTRIIDRRGNKFDLKDKIKSKGTKEISGFAVVRGDIVGSEPTDTLMGIRVFYFCKKHNVK